MKGEEWSGGNAKSPPEIGGLFALCESYESALQAI